MIAIQKLPRNNMTLSDSVKEIEAKYHIQNKMFTNVGYEQGNNEHKQNLYPIMQG